MFSNFTGRQGMSIFNRRRRLRQAVYASPQSQSTTTPLQIDIPDETLAEIAEDFDSSPGNYNFHASKTNPSATMSSNYNARSFSQSRQLPTPQKHPNNQHGNRNASPMKPRFEQESCFKARGSNDNSFGQRQNMGMSNNGVYDGNNFTNKQQNTAKRSFSFETTTSKPQQSYTGQTSQNSWNTTKTPAKASTANARKPGDHNGASFGTTMKQNKQARNDAPMTKNEVSHNNGSAGFSLETVDKSMKFVTATIQGVRKWSEYRDQLPLVFEVFATLDSVPTSNNNSTAKLFTIKDKTGAIRCIYWEMDHKLPRMARGQTYRLVGALARTSGHFQCFTIRQALPNEQQLAIQQVETCNNAMRKLTSMIAEA